MAKRFVAKPVVVEPAAEEQPAEPVTEQPAEPQALGLEGSDRPLDEALKDAFSSPVDDPPAAVEPAAEPEERSATPITWQSEAEAAKLLAAKPRFYYFLDDEKNVRALPTGLAVDLLMERNRLTANGAISALDALTGDDEIAVLGNVAGKPAGKLSLTNKIKETKRRFAPRR